MKVTSINKQLYGGGASERVKRKWNAIYEYMSMYAHMFILSENVNALVYVHRNHMLEIIYVYL